MERRIITTDVIEEDLKTEGNLYMEKNKVWKDVLSQLT